mmetsp:Transcript_12011/g.33959  ORF Transcript_12011/g.33959 Transcript_12011/m.33959 type:complete len:258 (-) Transcript_12011:25-798(-)
MDMSSIHADDFVRGKSCVDLLASTPELETERVGHARWSIRNYAKQHSERPSGLCLVREFDIRPNFNSTNPPKTNDDIGLIKLRVHERDLQRCAGDLELLKLCDLDKPEEGYLSAALLGRRPMDLTDKSSLSDRSASSSADLCARPPLAPGRPATSTERRRGQLLPGGRLSTPVRALARRRSLAHLAASRAGEPSAATGMKPAERRASLPRCPTAMVNGVAAQMTNDLLPFDGQDTVVRRGLKGSSRLFDRRYQCDTI